MFASRARPVHTGFTTARLGDVTGDDEASRDDEAKRKLRAALDGVDLLPETTSDERPDAPIADGSRDAELRRNVPPHHGKE